MNKRDRDGKYARRRSPLLILLTWLSGFASIGLLYLAGLAVKADIASFRSCDVNNAGLAIVGCGKQSINWGDIFLFAILALSATLTVSLFTAALRMTRSGRL